MGMFTSLGLKRPAPPRASAQGRFSIGGVTVINPMHGRRAGATLSIADGAISDISEGSSNTMADYTGCFALPGLIDIHVHLPPDNALKLTAGAALSYLAHGVTTVREAGDLDGTAINAACALRDDPSSAAPVLVRPLRRRGQGQLQEHRPFARCEQGSGRSRGAQGEGDGQLS
jgi:alpha-D-ribose 1-methylphosphonate 5-triphosphate diphosphatase PhnM